VRPVLPLIVLLATAAFAQDVYVPPVPIGIKRYRMPRKAKTDRVSRRACAVDRIRSAHYDVLSNASGQTRDIVRDLGRWRRSSRRHPLQHRGDPTTVLVFADRKESEPYRAAAPSDKPPMTGLYVRHGGGGDVHRRFTPQIADREDRDASSYTILRQSGAPHLIGSRSRGYIANGRFAAARSSRGGLRT
jgi:hypothetical protein